MTLSLARTSWLYHYHGGWHHPESTSKKRNHRGIQEARAEAGRGIRLIFFFIILIRTNLGCSKITPIPSIGGTLQDLITPHWVLPRLIVLVCFETGYHCASLH